MSAFDKSCEIKREGELGAGRGIWNKNEKLNYLEKKQLKSKNEKKYSISYIISSNTN